MRETLEEFVKFLQERKDRIVQQRDVLVARWDPTYGAQDPGTETIEVVDFDELCAAIDEFAGTFPREGP